MAGDKKQTAFSVTLFFHDVTLSFKIHVPLRMNYCGDPLALSLSNSLVHDQMPTKLMTLSFTELLVWLFDKLTQLLLSLESAAREAKPKELFHL